MKAEGRADQGQGGEAEPEGQLVYYGDVTLIERGEERTAVRFSVTSTGEVRNVNRLAKAIVPFRRAASRSSDREGGSLMNGP